MLAWRLAAACCAISALLLAPRGTVQGSTGNSPGIPDGAWRLAYQPPERLSPPPPFRLPMVFTAWGFQPWGVFHDPGALAKLMDDAGVRSVAIHIGEADPAVAEPFRARGLAVYLWGVAGENDQAQLDAFHADGYILQVEGPGQRDAALRNLQAGVGAGLPRALVTTFGGIDQPGEADPLIAAGAHTTFVEDYRQSGAPDVPRMLWQASAYGLPDPVAVVGLYDGVHLDAYTVSGRGFAVWLAEQMQPEDWAALTAI